MNRGDSIKWRNVGEKVWRSGYLLFEEAGQAHVERFPDDRNPITVPIMQVKQYRKRSEEEFEEFARSNIGELKMVIEKAAAELLPGKIEVEVKQDTYPILSILGGSLTVEPALIDAQTISGFEEQLGWSVTTWRNIPGTRREPPSVEDNEIGTTTSLDRAAVMAIDTAYKLLSDCYWTNHAENKLFAELENENKSE